jgi:hypothetical protein
MQKSIIRDRLIEHNILMILAKDATRRDELEGEPGDYEDAYTFGMFLERLKPKFPAVNFGDLVGLLNGLMEQGLVVEADVDSAAEPAFCLSEEFDHEAYIHFGKVL